MMFSILLRQFTTESRDDTETTEFFSPTTIPQEMMLFQSNPQLSNHSSVHLTTYEETGDDEFKSTMIHNQSILQSPKKVRFAMDDKVANRKKRKRNLRNRILEKSRSATETHSNSDPETTSNNREKEVTNTPHNAFYSRSKATNKVSVVSAKVGRRRKNFKMATSLFAGF